MKTIIRKIILWGIILVILEGCTISEGEEHDRGVTVKKYRWNISFHELGRTKKKLYYKGKKICSSLDFYILSPDSKYLLYSNEIKYSKARWEVYNTKKKKKYIFKHTFIFYQLDKPEEIIWNENKIRMIDGKKQTILYLDKNLFEIKNFYQKDYYFDYLLIQIDQLYNNISPKDRKRNMEKFKTYLGVRIDNRFFMSDKEISIESWEKIGNVFYTLINDLKEKYSTELAYQIFKRAFDEHFKVLEGKVIFVWK